MAVAVTLGILLLILITGVAASSRRTWKVHEAAWIAQIGSKYPDLKIGGRIQENVVWVGMTAQQLEDSWGKPLCVSRITLKTKIKETYRYGSGRHGSSVYLDDGIVTGWR